MTEHVTVGDGLENVAQAIAAMREKKTDMILCTGGMSVAPDDNTLRRPKLRPPKRPRPKKLRLLPKKKQPKKRPRLSLGTCLSLRLLP